MKARRYFTSSDYESDTGMVDLTPLLDVLFVVLILFILIAPLIDLDRIELAPAKAGPKEQKVIEQTCPIKLYVDQEGTILFQSSSLSLSQLEKLLKELHSMYPKEIPQLYFDQMAPFGLYQRIKNRMEEAGFESLDLILKSDSE